MIDGHYPNVDINFLIELVKKSPKVDGEFTVGGTRSFVIKGNRPIGERIVLIPQKAGNVNYEFATSIAIKLKCMPELTKWLENNKGWKDGAYSAKSTIGINQSSANANPQ